MDDDYFEERYDIMCYCTVCEDAIYEGDSYFNYNGENYCEDCGRDSKIDEFVRIREA